MLKLKLLKGMHTNCTSAEFAEYLSEYFCTNAFIGLDNTPCQKKQPKIITPGQGICKHGGQNPLIGMQK